MCILFLSSQLKEKITEAASAEVTNMDDEQPDTVQATGETSAETVPHQRQDPPFESHHQEPRPRRPYRKRSDLWVTSYQEESSQCHFSRRSWRCLLPSKGMERTAYVDWAKEVMIGLHPSLWLKFQREYLNLLYTYQEKSAQLLNSVTQQ